MSSKNSDENRDKFTAEIEAAIRVQVRLKVSEIYLQTATDPMFVAASALGLDIQKIVTDQIKKTLETDFEEGT